MNIVQDVKDACASSQVVSRRDEHLLPAMLTDTIFVGGTQSKILIIHKLQQERL